MKLESIEIENFRGIKKSKIEGFKRFNFFMGKNNSCKTSVLEAIFLNLGVSNPFLPVRINNFRNVGQSEEDDFRFVFYNLNYKNIPKFTSTFSKNQQIRTLSLTPHKKKSNSSLKKEKISNELNDSNFDSRIDSNFIDGLVLEATVKENHKKKKTLKSEIIFEQSSFSSKMPENYNEDLIGVFMYTTTQAPNLDVRLERLIVNKTYKPIIEVLGIVDKSIKDITLGTNGVIYFDIGIERLIPINLVGDGIRRILSILVTIVSASPKLPPPESRDYL